MGNYDNQSEERSPSNAANLMGSSVSTGMPGADGRAEDCFSQGASSSDTHPNMVLHVLFPRAFLLYLPPCHQIVLTDGT